MLRARKINRRIAGIFLLLIIGIVFSGCSQKKETVERENAEKEAVEEDYTPHDVSVLFINVGRADSCLVQIDDKNYLIDTGLDDSAAALYRGLASQGVTSLDGLILTHTHRDHIGGVEALSRRVSIDKVYAAEISQNEEDGTNKITSLAEELSFNLTRLNAGDSIKIAEDVNFEVLGPLTYNDEDDNDNSLVLRLHVNGRTFLFAGDMQFSEEKTLMQNQADLKADVLKVGNHGNPDATSEDFEEKVSPSVCVISTDTSADTDSANESVTGLFQNADIYVTQDYEIGVLLKVTEDGEIKVSSPKQEKTSMELSITDGDQENQTVTITNNGDDADLSDCFLYTEKGSETFIFPEGSILKAGKSIMVSCKDGSGDYLWDVDKLWKKKKKSSVYLYDSKGTLMDSYTCE